MVALDIDGTLHCAPEQDVLAHRAIGAATRAAVRAVGRSGAHVVLCTGRLSTATMPFLRELGLAAGFAVCSNGAVLIEAAGGRIVDQVQFDLFDTVTTLRDQLPGAVFVAETPGVGVLATGWMDSSDMHHGKIELVTIDELAAASTTRLGVHWPGRSGDEMARLFSTLVLPGIRCCCYNDEPLADLTAAAVSKAAMLEKLRIALGIAKEETMAVGDGVNDVEMLHWAAHGVAMSGSPAASLATVHEICPPAAEDGVAVVLSRWFG
ncbi:hypothetical protein B1R94_12795 [Mycolicibacterium litorale]|nr:hypothetical protein B1R94_12795 [Mycolicibacterium litorale]